MGRIGGDAEAEGEWYGVAGEVALDRGAQALGHQVGLVLGGARQQQRELLPAGAGDRVAGAAEGGEDPPDPHERVVAGAVPQLVVDGLEVVEVADDDAEHRFRAQRALDLDLDLSLQRQPVLQPCQGVCARRLQKALNELAHTVAQAAHERGGWEEDGHEREPAAHHIVRRDRSEQHGEVGAAHQRQLGSGLAGGEEIRGVQGKPAVQHLAGQRRPVGRLEHVKRYQQRPAGGRGLERG